MAALMIVQNQNRISYPCYIMDILYQDVLYIYYNCGKYINNPKKYLQNPYLKKLHIDSVFVCFHLRITASQEES